MAFPADPLDIRTKLYIGGEWIDISGDVRASSGITIRRGRADEGTRSDPAKCSLTLDNRDGRYSPRNPASPYYGKLGRNTPIRVGVDTGTTALVLDGSNVLAATTPDTSALDISGDLDIRMLVALDRWSSTNAQTFIGKAEGAYSFGKDEYDLLRFEWTTTDNTFRVARSTIPVSFFPNGSAQWVRMVYDRDSGGGQHTTTFYISEDGVTWDQFGDPSVGPGTFAIAANSTPLALGNRGDLVSPMAGRIYKVEVYDGNTLVASPDFTSLAEGTTSFTDSAGRTWTVTNPYEVTSLDYRFTGEVSAWPPRWDVSGRDVTVPIEAAGILRRLGQGANTLKSAMYRGLTSPTAETGVVAYWPCEDAEGSTSLASGVGGPPMKIRGVPDLASFDGFASSDPIPVLKGSTWTGVVPGYTATGKTQVRLLLAVPSDGDTASSVIARIQTTGSANRWELDYDGGAGLIALRAYTGEGTQIVNSTSIAFNVNGRLFRFSVELVQNGSNVDWSMSALEAGGSAGVFGGTLSGHTVGTVSKIIINPDGALTDTAIGHVSVQSALTSLFNLADQLNAWNNEPAGRRLIRLCQEEGIPILVTDDPDATARLGPQRPATLLDLLSEAAEADMGILAEPRGRFGLLYRPRRSLYNQAPSVQLDYEAGHLAPPLEPVDDDQATRNDIVVRRDGGSSARATLESGPLSVQDPPDGVGRYSEEVTVSVRSDAHLPDQAGWRLHLGTVDEARYPSITVNLAAPALTGDPELSRAVTHLDVGDRLTVSNPPLWLPPGQISQIARGFEERLSPFDWSVTVTCSPASPWQVAVYGLGRYGPAGSELASDIDEDDTSISVTTTLGPRWTTDPSHLPFSVLVGGEVMEVTAISGTGSTQTFTVSRGINGVNHAHPAGTAVVLAERAIRAL